mgnify:CR=1 FL=1
MSTSINSKLKLYNTRTRETADFKPLVAGKVGIYICGATVQSFPHIGHVRSGINFDILRRWLSASGYEVTFIRNVTDIDDKILEKSKSENMPWWALAFKYEQEFQKAYALLNVLPPTYEPRATGHITQMIELMQALIANGAAYAPGNGDVYLEVRKLNSYLTLSRQKLDDLLPAGDADESAKRDVRDFALWKAAKPGEPSWPTPWGDGRPGWHSECVVMSLELLGEGFDLHCGGADLRFPHHENERAQSNPLVNGEAVSQWLHGEHLLFEGRKMSKSAGNVVLVSHLINKGLDPLALRFCFLENRYRSQMDLSWESITAAHQTLAKWRLLATSTQPTQTQTTTGGTTTTPTTPTTPVDNGGNSGGGNGNGNGNGNKGNALPAQPVQPQGKERRIKKVLPLIKLRTLTISEVARLF